MIQQQANTSLIPDLIKRLQQQQQHAGHRQFIVLSGQQQWGMEHALELLQQQHLWLGEAPAHPKILHKDLLNKAKHWLGRERQQVIINAFSQFSADGIAAISGIIPAGGQLILVCPEFTHWPEYDDPNYRQLLSYQQPRPHKSLFLTRLIRHFQPTKGICLWQQQQGLSYVDNPVVVSTVHLAQGIDDSSSSTDACLSANPQQQDAIHRIIKCATGRARRPLVITADRGRGKSASLGLACATLIEQHQQQILVCAPNRHATQSVLRFAGKGLGQDARHYPVTGPFGQLDFIAPDHLLRARPCADVIMVDEAAAIPMPMLKAICHHYPRVVFASTQHGYEGSGRGFSLKFMQYLQQDFKHYKHLHLNEPIRWRSHDPLEDWTFANFILNAHAQSVNLPITAKQWRYQVISKEALMANEALLNQAFALLVNAHYQTKPSDLRALLDNARISVHLVFHQQDLLAISLLMDEPPLPQPLSQAIHQGTRRVQGHLTAQALSLHAGQAEAVGYHYGRVMRIAVHPESQSHGVGTFLLDKLFSWSQQQGFDFLCTSFGFTPDLASFWQRSQFQLNHLGLSKDVASGCYSVIAMRPCKQQVQAFTTGLSSQLQQQLQDYLTGPLQDLEADVANALIAWLKASVSSNKHPVGAYRDAVLHYCLSHRPVEFALPAIRQWLWQLPQWPCLLPSQSDLLIQRCLQQHTWQQVVAANQLSGKKAAETQLKLILQQVLQDQFAPPELPTSQ
ncbi:tRNA(Met) cytidine acetyltransferase TmcA [Motilimonas pumila]|uniref:tRNA(Met) cytidine acetyltransferase TmcA n=1 Tax=Motilimonas pumila TaxID=2303987 RepID=A0A418YJL8_9GAMM|nr:GNAT family N-acetyltransferase [Motilimonas pumila]RJG50674.1 tRNA(Met) cytidine acetyltransferase [Motilimonas pumila]